MSRIEQKPHHHCLISGTGRSGTTFLITLLTHLGVDTGFTRETARVENSGHAGLELKSIKPSSPYVIKSPRFCDRLDKILSADPSIKLDCVVIPTRDLSAAAESRAATQFLSTGARSGSGQDVRGGLWETTEPDAQNAVLERKLSALMVCVARHDIPVVMLWFPRLTKDPRYLYGKLQFLLGDTSYAEFEKAFSEAVRPEWVHQFTPHDI